MKCNGKTLAKECQKVRDGKSDLRKSAKRCGYSLRQFRRKYSEFLSKGESSFVHGNKGKNSARRLSEDVRKAIIEDYSEHIPIIQLHTFLRKDKRQIQRIKTSRISDPCRGKLPISDVPEKEKKERGGPSVKAEKNGVRSAHPGRRHILRFLQ